MTPAPADLERWSEELARDPASLAFLPLARAYRRQGRLELAIGLCHRGLEQHPAHIEGHALLALLFLESGDRARAADEWSTILRFEAGNFEALRGMGFRYLELDQIEKAQQHLERAAHIRPADPAVQEARQLLRTRMAEAATRADVEGEGVRPAVADQEGGVLASDSADDARTDPDTPLLELGQDEAIDILGLGDAEVPARSAANGALPSTPLRVSPRWEEELTAAAGYAPAPVRPPTAEPRPGVGREDATAGKAVPAQGGAALEDGGAVQGQAADPTRLFDSMLEGPVSGVLLVDGQGRVLAGRLASAAASQNEAVGALIGGTADEAARVVEHLGLHEWKGLMLECGNAAVQLSRAGEDAMLVVVARRDSPRGWLARAANQAIVLSEPLLRGDS